MIFSLPDKRQRWWLPFRRRHDFDELIFRDYNSEYIWSLNTQLQFTKCGGDRESISLHPFQMSGLYKRAYLLSGIVIVHVYDEVDRKNVHYEIVSDKLCVNKSMWFKVTDIRTRLWDIYGGLTHANQDIIGKTIR